MVVRRSKELAAAEAAEQRQRDDPRGADGFLTKKERDQIGELLLNRLGVRTCEMCDATTWVVGNRLVSPVMLRVMPEDAGVQINLSIVIPSVHIFCENCGNTKTFAADKIGFMPPWLMME